MKLLIVLAIVVLAINAKPANVSSSAEISVKSQWEAFKLKYSKSYDVAEEKTRFMIFSDKLASILQHNAEEALGLHTYTMGINIYTDKNNDEMSTLANGYKRPAGQPRTGAKYLSPEGLAAPPTTLDWRTKGYVTPVKDQNPCGSCWAFSSTGSLEGQHFRATGKLVSLSEQNLIDCSRKYGNNGCKGGLMDDSFRYIRDNKGINTDISYPYERRDDQPCRFKMQNVGATLSSYVDAPEGSEEKLQEILVTIGPVSVAIDADHDSFYGYEAGVYIEPKCSPTELGHAVLLVGYGKANGHDYWLVKNSWGVNWGEKGYIRMARNLKNQCGIASMASYPVV